MLRNPFNPQQPAKPELFTGREQEITRFKKFLSQTSKGSPMNLAVTGNRGVGKTSLLKKFESIARSHGSIVLNLSGYERRMSETIDLEEYISENLKREFISRHPADVESIKEIIAGFKLTLGALGATLSVEKKKSIAAGLLRSKLLSMWTKIKKHHDSVVILIDEAESLEKTEESLPFLREAFQRIQSEANYMIVLSGKLRFPEKLADLFSPLNRFFPCARLKPFNQEEATEYVKKNLSSEGLEIQDSALKSIYGKSEGHPYILTLICYILVDSLQDEETTISKSVFERCEEKILAEITDVFFYPIYHSLTPKAKKILRDILQNLHGREFNSQDATRWTKLEPSQLSPYLKELVEKSILDKPERGKYALLHNMLAECLKSEH